MADVQEAPHGEAEGRPGDIEAAGEDRQLPPLPVGRRPLRRPFRGGQFRGFESRDPRRGAFPIPQDPSRGMEGQAGEARGNIGENGEVAKI